MTFRLVLIIAFSIIQILIKFKVDCLCAGNPSAQPRIQNIISGNIVTTTPIVSFTNSIPTTYMITTTIFATTKITHVVTTTTHQLTSTKHVMTTTSPSITTTTVVIPVKDNYVVCATYMKVSKTFGTIDPSSKSFSISTSALSSMQIYSDKYVHAIMFNFTSGASVLYGNTTNARRMTQINLINQQIVAANIDYDSNINSLQFLLYQNVTQKYSWTSWIGGIRKGNLSSISWSTLAPNAVSFRIAYFNGTANSESLLSLNVAYLVKECRPASLFKIRTTPPTPSHESPITTTVQQM